MGKIDLAVEWAKRIANDNSHGYDQANRWGTPDYDCSSFIISAWEQAGVPVKTKGAQTTHNMKSIFLACGFKDVKSSVNTSTGSGLQRGDVLLNEANHTAMYIGNNQSVAAHYNENKGTTGGQPGDQSKYEISITAYSNFQYGWDCVLRYTGSDAGGGETGTTRPTLSLGSTGSEVKLMQQKLMMLGFSCGTSGADGDFGSGTQTAVKQFQSKNGLTADGVCGANTHTKLDAKYKALGVFTATCNLEGLKVRTGDSTNYAIFSAYPSLKKGEKVKVARVTANNWYFALVGERYTAYVAAKYMKRG